MKNKEELLVTLMGVGPSPARLGDVEKNEASYAKMQYSLSS